MFEKALEHRSDATATRCRQSSSCRRQQGDWEAVVHAKRGLMVTAATKEKVDAPRTRSAASTTTSCRTRRRPPAAYLEALELTPEDHQLLQKVLDLYTETKQWKKAVETIERFIALEPDAVRRGVYYHAAATVCRDELKSLDEAVDYYNKALDASSSSPSAVDDQMVPRALSAFEAIDKVLTTKRDWKAQERAYRDMIKRLPEQTATRVPAAAGRAVRRARRDSIAAASSTTRAPPRPTRSRSSSIRRTSCGATGPTAPRSSPSSTWWPGPDVHRQGDRAAHAHAAPRAVQVRLVQGARAHLPDTQQYDKHWCLCNTLTFLKKADRDEQRFYEQYKPRGLVKAKSSMSADTWAKLAHDDENRYISAIFGACGESVAAMKAFPYKDFGVKRRTSASSGDQLLFAGCSSTPRRS